MLILLTVILAGIDFIVPGKTFAYIDPNTGGYIFHVFAPIFFSILGIMMVFYRLLIKAAKKTFSNILSLIRRDKTS